MILHVLPHQTRKNLSINLQKWLIDTNIFDESFDTHAQEIYDSPSWPEKPLFYICAPSKTDDSVAPNDMENIFILIPVAPGIKEEEDTRDKYFQHVLARLKKLTGEDIKEEDILMELKRS